jgi:hypothetical protein
MNRKEVQAAVNKICDTPLKTPLFDIANEVGVLQNLAEKWLGEQEKMNRNPLKGIYPESEKLGWAVCGGECDKTKRLEGELSQLRCVFKVTLNELNVAQKEVSRLEMLRTRGEEEDECPVCYNGKSHCTCVLGDLRKAKEEREENER